MYTVSARLESEFLMARVRHVLESEESIENDQNKSNLVESNHS